jgi:hypothetical protein
MLLTLSLPNEFLESSVFYQLICIYTGKLKGVKTDAASVSKLTKRADKFVSAP